MCDGTIDDVTPGEYGATRDLRDLHGSRDSGEPREWTSLPEGPHDVRLVVSDMDGTLLTERGVLPDGFWSVFERLRERGIAFVPASGRQYATLAELFAPAGDDLTVIADNGNLVMRGGTPVSVETVDASVVSRVLEAARAAADARDLGVVVSGVRSAYVERTDDRFLEQVTGYYAQLARVDDLAAVDDEVLKLAVYDFGGSQAALDSVFSEIARDLQVVVSGERWLDIMRPGVHKGGAIEALQRRLGVTPAQTAVFGDFLNDLEMMDAAEWSFAMENAHPDVRAAARYIAPSNARNGVLAVLERLLRR